MELVAAIVAGVLLVAGAFFNVAAGIGVLRLPDVFTRLHAAGMKDTMGSALTLIGLSILGGFSLVTVKLLIIWARWPRIPWPERPSWAESGRCSRRERVSARPPTFARRSPRTATRARHP